MLKIGDCNDTIPYFFFEIERRCASVNGIECKYLMAPTPEELEKQINTYLSRYCVYEMEHFTFLVNNERLFGVWAYGRKKVGSETRPESVSGMASRRNKN